VVSSLALAYDVNTFTHLVFPQVFAATLCLAVAIPAVYSLFGDVGTISLGTVGTGTAAITGLSAGAATVAGLGGLVAAIGVGGALGGLAAAATRGAGGRGGRSGRSVESNQELGEKFVFDAIAAIDDQDCGKRYLCELAASPLDELSQDDFTTLLLFQSAPATSNSGKALFDEAVRLGAITRSQQTCQIRYQGCPVIQNAV